MYNFLNISDASISLNARLVDYDTGVAISVEVIEDGNRSRYAPLTLSRAKAKELAQLLNKETR